MASKNPEHHLQKPRVVEILNTRLEQNRAFYADLEKHIPEYTEPSVDTPLQEGKVVQFPASEPNHHSEAA